MITTMSDRQLAEMALGPDCKPSSWKFIQQAIRRGELRARKIGRKWRILEDDAKEWISYRNK
jgi:excisionase family DNA binding protein